MQSIVNKGGVDGSLGKEFAVWMWGPEFGYQELHRAKHNNKYLQYEVKMGEPMDC